MRFLRKLIVRTVLTAGAALLARKARDVHRRRKAPAYGAGAERDTNLDAPSPVRPAGAEAMRDPPERWDETDERSDESFPASDPAAKY